MTFILAGRFDDGIIVCYDTVSLRKKDDHYQISNYVRKFNVIDDYPHVGLGMYGNYIKNNFYG